MSSKFKVTFHQSSALSVFWIVYFWVWVLKHPRTCRSFETLKHGLQGQIPWEKCFSSSISIKSYDLKAKFCTVKRSEQATGKCKGMGELILPNTFPLSTKANMMWDENPGRSRWETTFSEAVVKKCNMNEKTGANVMLFLGILQPIIRKLSWLKASTYGKPGTKCKKQPIKKRTKIPLPKPVSS